MIPGGGYTRGEVLWLLQMDREQAIDQDAYPGGALNDDQGGDVTVGTSAEDSQLFVIARWWDVRRAARQALAGDFESAYMIALRLYGYSEQETSAKLGAKGVTLSRATVHRRFRVVLDQLLMALGPEPEAAMPFDRVDMCLNCSRRPRAYLEAVKVKVRGQSPRTIAPAKRSSVCEECLAPGLRPRLAKKAAA